MERKLKETLVKALKGLIKSIEKGHCDSMTKEQYDKLIECLQTLVEVKETKKDKLWNFGK